MDAFGNKLHLKLRRNTQLVKPGLELETRHDNGNVTRTPVSRDSYFHGTVASDQGSLVAVSNADGLVRSVSFFFLFNTFVFFTGWFILRSIVLISIIFLCL